MKKYYYQIIRYVHDHFTGEFVNVGVIVFSKEHNFLGCKTIHKYQRITHLFPEANRKTISHILRYLENEIQAEGLMLDELQDSSDRIDVVLNTVLSNDNNTFQFTDPKAAIDIDLQVALDDLYLQLVEKYYPRDKEKQTLSDNDVWRITYKSHFEKYGILDRLKPHKVKVPNDEITFSLSWKNEIWHNYEPLSLELKKKDNIKEKVYKWAGKLQALKLADEALYISFLTSLHPNHEDVLSFIKEYLQTSEGKLKVDVVTADQAENVAKSIKMQMVEHSQGNKNERRE